MKNSNVKLLEKFALALLVTGILGLVTITLLFLLNTTAWNLNALETSIWNNYGGTIGGSIGVLFSLVGALFLIINLREQRRNTAKQQIETHFYQMLQLHRNNVAEMQSKGHVGRSFFVNIKDEFHILLAKLQTAVIPDPGEEWPPLTIGKEVNIAYLTLYFGVRNSSENYLRTLIAHIIGDEKNLSDKIFTRFLEGISEEQRKVESRNIHNRYRKKFLPYDGHQSRLGHYFRHLFQIVTFINDQPNGLLSYHDKKHYIKVLRAQLSTHEQAIFLYNSLSELGSAWEKEKTNEEEKLITKYNLIKNLPMEFSIGIDASSFYPNVSFEHQGYPAEMERKKWESIYK
jgi:hypothetical protein